MSSALVRAERSPSDDDRTTRARIRDAAVECYAEFGVAGTTARKVAECAGVSPGLVIHHFGTMDGLRRACDEHVVSLVRHTKREAIGAGLGLDVGAAWRDADIGHLGAYLARVLVDDSPAVARLVDDLVGDAVEYLALGIDTGQVRPLEDVEGVAAMTVLWSLGGLVLHEHMRRLLGVDLTGPGLGSDPSFVRYAAPAFQILGEGIFTDAFAAHVRDAITAYGDDAGVADAVAGVSGPTEGST